jgi:hypothetical protein
MTIDYRLDATNSREHEEIESAINAFNYDLERELQATLDDSYFQDLFVDTSPLMSSFESSAETQSGGMSSSDNNIPSRGSFDMPTLLQDTPAVVPVSQTTPWTQQYSDPQDTRAESGLHASILEGSILPQDPAQFSAPTHDWQHKPTAFGESFVPWVPTAGSSDGSASNLVTFAQEKSQRARRVGRSNGRSTEELNKMDPLKVKRIMSNRASAARSKERRKQELEYLEQQSQHLSMENERLRQQIQQIGWILQDTVESMSQKRQQVANLNHSVQSLVFSNNALEGRIPTNPRSSKFSELSAQDTYLRSSYNVPVSMPAQGFFSSVPMTVFGQES